MLQLLYIGLGGFLGATARFLASKFMGNIFGTFPLGTLFVNVTGSFVLAFISYLVFFGKAVPSDFRSFATIGAYTTMSTFSYETMRYLDQGEYGYFALNLFLNVGLCFAGIALGRYCALLLAK